MAIERKACRQQNFVTKGDASASNETNDQEYV